MLSLAKLLLVRINHAVKLYSGEILNAGDQHLVLPGLHMEQRVPVLPAKGTAGQAHKSGTRIAPVTT